MLDWIRELRKSAEERRQDRITAYIDGQLSAADARRFEAEMAQDEALRAEVTQLQFIKSQLRSMPRARVPRNFTLDPATYGATQQQSDWGMRAYPILQGATALAAVVFIVMATLTFSSSGTADLAAFAPAPAAESIMADSTTDSAAADMSATDASDAMVEEAIMGEAELEEVDMIEAEPAAEEMVEQVVEVEALVVPTEEPAPADAEVVEREAAEDDSGAAMMDSVEMADDVMADDAIVAGDVAAVPTLMPLPTQTVADFRAVELPTTEPTMMPTPLPLPTIEIVASQPTLDEKDTARLESMTEYNQSIPPVQTYAVPVGLIASGVVLVILITALVWLRRRQF